MSCIFCRIVSGEVPAMKVYEDENTLVFMDVAADVDGHMLAIPKKHVESILDCDGEILAQLMAAVRHVSRKLADSGMYEGVNLLNASGAAAGQSVPHFHIHIIPRAPGDGIDAWPAFTGAEEDVQRTYEKLKTEAFR